MGLFGCTPDKVASTRQQYMTLGTQNRTADIVAWSGQLSLGVDRTPNAKCVLLLQPIAHIHHRQFQFQPFRGQSHGARAAGSVAALLGLPTLGFHESSSH
jgi:hypothetical protein